METKSVGDALESAIKRLIYETVLKAVIARAIAAAPFLAWPVVNPVFVYILTKIADAIYDELKVHVTFDLIDIRTEQEQKEYDEKVLVLKVAQESQNEEAIRQAEAEFKEKLATLIRFRRPAAA